MTEPCPRCPGFVVRCRHRGKGLVRVIRQANAAVPRWKVAMERYDWIAPLYYVSGLFATRALADAEFERREGELLGSSALLA